MNYLALIALLVLPAACAHKAPLMTPTEMEKYEAKKDARARRKAEHDAAAAARETKQGDGVDPSDMINGSPIPGERRGGFDGSL